MLPLFGDHRRREINLGGSSSATSQAVILNQARARRIERETIRKRQESAVTIQAWWRGITGARRVRQHLREQFTGDVTGLTGLRCLVLIGQDDDVLDRWATEVLSQGTLYGYSILTLTHGSIQVLCSALPVALITNTGWY
jgi:ubiquitin-protein ligase E3 C